MFNCFVIIAGSYCFTHTVAYIIHTYVCVCVCVWVQAALVHRYSWHQDSNWEGTFTDSAASTWHLSPLYFLLPTPLPCPLNCPQFGLTFSSICLRNARATGTMRGQHKKHKHKKNEEGNRSISTAAVHPGRQCCQLGLSICVGGQQGRGGGGVGNCRGDQLDLSQIFSRRRQMKALAF